jgi:hypothetical protein
MAAGLALLPITLVGCGKEEPPPPPPPAPRNTAPPPPPPPDQVRVADILREVDADARVQFPQEQAPYDRSLAEAVIVLAGSIAAGDDLAMAPVLDPAGRAVLDQLVASGEWYDATGEIEGVRIVFVSQSPDENTEASAAKVVLAVQDPGEAYVLAWNATNAGDGWRFSAEPSTGQTKARASEWDADTMAAFSASAGMGGGRGLGSGDSFDSMTSAVLSDPPTIYFAVEISRQLAKVLGVELSDEELFGPIAQGAGMSEERALELYTRGRLASRENGQQADPAVVGPFIMSARAIGQATGVEVTDEQLIEAIAAVYQIDESEARAYFEEAQP